MTAATRAADLLKLTKPWYFVAHESDTGESVAGAAGLKAWVDTTIKVEHANVFAIDEFFSERFADRAEPRAGSAETPPNPDTVWCPRPSASAIPRWR